MAMDGLPWSADGRGDFASAAGAAPPELYPAYAAALAELPRYLPGHGEATASPTAGSAVQVPAPWLPSANPSSRSSR
jgi:hypothetical protein